MEGINIFDQCAHGIQCWAERQRRKTASYSPFTDSGTQKGRDTEDEDVDSPN